LLKILWDAILRLTGQDIQPANYLSQQGCIAAAIAGITAVGQHTTLFISLCQRRASQTSLMADNQPPSMLLSRSNGQCTPIMLRDTANGQRSQLDCRDVAKVAFS